MSGAAFWLIVPYAAWMALMVLLPATPWAYAVRAAVVACLLVAVCARMRLRPPIRPLSRSAVQLLRCSTIGFFVFLVWILPEQSGWEWYRRWCIVGDGGTESIASASAALVAARLVGSAFVIPFAEELFFRKWLMGFAGFGWMVALFAVEHDRWLVGAVAGAVYGIVFLRHGLFASVVSHASTNLFLGVWVLWTGQWRFW